jgi:coiled-coil family 90 protein
MAITTLDTHQTVKDLTAAGFTDAQAEALTQALRQVQQIDLSDLATKADVADLRKEIKADLALLRAELDTRMAEHKADLIRWVFGIAFAQAALILAVLKLFPGSHP